MRPGSALFSVGPSPHSRPLHQRVVALKYSPHLPPPTSPAWPPSCAACLFLSPHLFPSLPGSWTSASSGRQACRQAWGCFSALCSLASRTGLCPGRLRAPYPVSGRAAPPQAETAWWGGTGPGFLPCLGSPSLPVTPRPQTEGLLPVCL